MHMLGAMYAPNDRITLMAMLPYITKQMDHLTYQGGAGTTVLGGFRTKSEGIGDVKVSALIGHMTSGNHKLHLNMGGQPSDRVDLGIRNHSCRQWRSSHRALALRDAAWLGHFRPVARHHL
ncbi:hypothetical protein [Roseovarius gaetbuli]|nr:hypothetical protein [Roseovarius gaetbuli]